MNKNIQRLLTGLLSMGLAACSAGLFGDNVIRVTETGSSTPKVAQQRYAASIRVQDYIDGRNTGNPHKIGSSSQIVIGMSGRELLVEPEVSAIVSNSMKRRLDDAGYTLVDTDALYELSGEVKVLRYDVKERDEISIVLESTLKELATGKVVWSGAVVEKTERFAGVSGNSKKDIANYLRARVAVVAGKTAEAISASLMASRPDLFNLKPGTRPIPGVSEHAAPPVQTPPASALAAPADTAAATGVLQLTSKPARARIYIDAVYYGLTPLRLELGAGIHDVSAQSQSYRTSSEKVSIRKGETTELEMQLQR